MSPEGLTCSLSALCLSGSVFTITTMAMSGGWRERILLRERIPSTTGVGRLIWNISKNNYDQSPKDVTLLMYFTGIPSHTVQRSSLYWRVSQGSQAAQSTRPRFFFLHICCKLEHLHFSPLELICLVLKWAHAQELHSCGNSHIKPCLVYGGGLETVT